MFIVYSTFSTKVSRDVERFANPKTFRQAFMEETGSDDGSWTRRILIDNDPQNVLSANFDVTAGLCYLFYAKDKDTLRDGMKACPPAVKMICRPGQIGFFSGSYDFEKIGAWGRSKAKGGQLWDTIKNEERYGTGDRIDISRAKFDTVVNRQRLLERGYFLLICNSELLAGVRNARRMMGSEMSLSAIARLMSGKAPKMERQQALGVLMDSLNL